MEENHDKPTKHKNEVVAVENGVSKLMTKQIENNAFSWTETVTVINLSGRNITALNGNVTFPRNLLHLDLSRNNLKEVPATVLNLDKLTLLNIAHNGIQYFDECPEFCHTLEHLDLSHNKLNGPPYWVWAVTPQKLTKLNLNHNPNISISLIDGYFEELLQYPTIVTEINIENCRLGKFVKLFGTFPKAKTLCLGCKDYSTSSNSLIELPSDGLDKCSELESLIACNTNIYTVNSKIEQYKNLVVLDLAENNFNGLPKEFCYLESLEVCVLSGNKLLYLPEEMYQLKRLRVLYLDSNNLCMLPERFKELQNLKTLDLYDNHLNEVPYYDNLDEFDFAQNYCEEPNDSDAYLEKKERIRLEHENRYDGCRDVTDRSDYSSEERTTEEDDEELYDIFYNGKTLDTPTCLPPSSPEDWDSDDYWVPYPVPPLPDSRSLWLSFVKRKMNEGNFCPVDAHMVSVAEKVKYERMCNPVVFHEVQGQFDDCSSDES